MKLYFSRGNLVDKKIFKGALKTTGLPMPNTYGVETVLTNYTVEAENEEEARQIILAWEIYSIVGEILSIEEFKKIP